MTQGPKKLPGLLVSLMLISSVLLPWNMASGQNELLTADLGTCRLENGQAIDNCHVTYRAYGQRNADSSNIVLMPTWYNGSAEDLATYGYLGPNGIVDTDHFQVIAVNAFGNGKSTSPSNSQQNPFPEFTIRDLVNAQYRLLKEHLGLNQVHAVVGTSMGGHQVYEWLMLYPEFASRFVPIEGSPWPTHYDTVKERAWMAALQTPQESSDDIQRVSELISAIDTLVYWTPEYVNRNFGGSKGIAAVEEFSHRYDWSYLQNRASQTRAILTHDIRRDRDNYEALLGRITPSRILSVVFTRDMTVNPAPSRELGQKLGFEVLEIDGDCGHFGPNPECYQEEVTPAVNRFLLRDGGDRLQRRSMNVDGIEREYFVFHPDVPKTSGLPVVFALHGYGGTATGFASTYALNEHASRHGYVIVYPQGSHFWAGENSDDSYLVTSWNDQASNFTPTAAGPHCTPDRLEYPCPPECGQCNHCSWVSCHDDVGFIMRVVDEVTKEFKTDPTRYYLLGNSNGGTLAQRIACDHGEQFAAVGISIIQMPPGHACGPSIDLPMLHLFGALDDVIGHDGSPTKYGWIFTSAAENTRAWAVAMGCDDETVPWRTPLTERQGLQCSAYAACRTPGQQVVSCMDPRAAHEWRGQRLTDVPYNCVTESQRQSFSEQPACPKPRSRGDLWGMDLFWQFFSRYERSR